MPLQHLGQLQPTMAQIVKLAAMLKALNEQGAPTAPTALSRGLAPQTVTPYAGPVSALGGKKSPLGIYPELSKGYFREGAGSLEEILRAATPALNVPGVDYAAQREEASAKRGEMAKGMYDRLLPLDAAGRKIVINAMPSQVRRDMIEGGYMDAAGNIPEKEKEEKKISSVESILSDTGEQMNVITYDDGTQETKHTYIYPAPEEKKGVEPTISESVALTKLEMELQEYDQRYVKEAIDNMGPMPRIGEQIKVGENWKSVTQKHIDDYKNGIIAYIKMRQEMSGGGATTTLDDVKLMYQGRPELIKNVQQMLGLPETGVWDAALETAFSTYGGVK